MLRRIMYQGKGGIKCGRGGAAIPVASLDIQLVRFIRDMAKFALYRPPGRASFRQPLREKYALYSKGVPYKTYWV